MQTNFLYLFRLLVRFGFIFVLLSPLFGATFFIGTFSSALLFGQIPLSDPFAGLQVILSHPATLFTSFAISLGIILVTYAILGRVFCSWVCPLGLLLEISDKLFSVISAKFIKAFNKLPDKFKRIFPSNIFQDNTSNAKNVKAGQAKQHHTKYIILLTVFIVALLASMPVFELFSPMAIFMRIMIFGIGLEVLLVIIVMMSNWIYGSGTWCNKICPLGAFYSILGSVRLLRIKLHEDNCIQCGKCYDQACKYGSWILEEAVLEKNSYKISSECTNCGDCIKACKYDALSFSVKLPKPVTADFKQISSKR